MAETIVNQNTLERCRLTSKDIRLLLNKSSILNDEALEFGREIIAMRVTDVILSRAVKEIVGGEIVDISVANMKKCLAKDEFLVNMMRNTTSTILAVSLLDTSKYGVGANYAYKRGCKVYGVETMSQTEIKTLAEDSISIVDFNIEVMLKNIRSKMMSIVNINKAELEIIKSIEELDLFNKEFVSDMEKCSEKFLEVAGKVYPESKSTIIKKGKLFFKSEDRDNDWKLRWMRDKRYEYFKPYLLLAYLRIIENERKWMSISVYESPYIDALVELTRTKKESFEDKKLADMFIKEMKGKLESKVMSVSRKLATELIILADKFGVKEKSEQQ